jgi:hypothetical protein
VGTSLTRHVIADYFDGAPLKHEPKRFDISCNGQKKSPADEAGQKLIDYGMMFSGHG